MIALKTKAGKEISPYISCTCHLTSWPGETTHPLLNLEKNPPHRIW